MLSDGTEFHLSAKSLYTHGICRCTVLICSDAASQSSACEGCAKSISKYGVPTGMLAFAILMNP